MQIQEADYYIKGILNSEMAVLSRAITLVESQLPKHKQLAQQILDGIISHTGNSFRLGVTGVPGVGKSSFIEVFGQEVLAHGNKLAVLAVDPSSTLNKGSILGDKTRMESLSTLEHVFIRPSPSGGSLGGVTRSTYETILLCEAAGYDFILVETVGVGQSEIAVSKITDFFLLLMLAGAGDELQGIKRGIMEMADALVITKADGDNVNKAKSAKTEYAHALHLLQAHDNNWISQTHICSALENKGMSEIYKMIEEYKLLTVSNGSFNKKRHSQQYELFLNSIDEQLRLSFFSNEKLQKRMKEIKAEKNIHPFSLAKQIMDEFYKK